MSAPPLRPPLARQQRGVSLIEALVAFLIMSFGMLAVVGMQGTMRRSADLSKQRGEAVRLAQADLDLVRDFSVLELDPAALPASAPASGAPAQARAFAQIASQAATEIPDVSSNTTFSLKRDVIPAANGNVALVRVTVSWSDRAGQVQQLVLNSSVARVDPKLSASLTIPPGGSSSTRGGMGRHASIPLNARDLGNGESVLKPRAGGTDAWAFNNATGLVRVCSVTVDKTQSSIVASDLNDCFSGWAFPLSGFIRFSTGESVNAALAESPSSTAIAGTGLELTLSSSGHSNGPRCVHDAYPSGNAIIYLCAIFPNAATPPIWSGSTQVTGLTLGAEAGQYKVCRYSDNYDYIPAKPAAPGVPAAPARNTTVDNAEHPLVYSNVTGPLINQNFLIIRGSLACPADRQANPAAGDFINSNTVEHQPLGVETPSVPTPPLPTPST